VPEVALLCLCDAATSDFADEVRDFAARLTGAGLELADARSAHSGVDASCELDELVARGRPTLVVRAASWRRSRDPGREPVLVATHAGPALVVPPAFDATALAEPGERLGARFVAAAEVAPTVGLVTKLSERELRLIAAESCTGGMLGSRITAVPGSSDVFYGSLVTYSYDAKTAVLGVDTRTLVRHGAVSEEVVRAMARGARALGGVDVSVAISGIAGPGGGTPEKPVGTVWIACETARGGEVARLLHLEGSRDRIRKHAVRECARLVTECLD